MKVYVVLTEDRHSDPGIKIFAGFPAAIKYAKATAEEYAGYNHQEEVVVSHSMDRPYHGEYSSEGDSVSVFEKEVEES